MPRKVSATLRRAAPKQQRYNNKADYMSIYHQARTRHRIRRDGEHAGELLKLLPRLGVNPDHCPCIATALAKAEKLRSSEPEWQARRDWKIVQADINRVYATEEAKEEQIRIIKERLSSSMPTSLDSLDLRTASLSDLCWVCGMMDDRSSDARSASRREELRAAQELAAKKQREIEALKNKAK